MEVIRGGLPAQSELAVNCVYTALLQPVNVVKILIQVGYEPLPPVYKKPSLFFFSGGYYYPNIFRYMQHLVKKNDSKLVLYRGLTPRLGAVFITNTVRSEVLGALPPSTSKCPPEHIAIEIGRQCTATTMAVIASHPLLVLTNRMIVSLIGGEDKYSSCLSAISTIISEEGIVGFYAGIVPHLLGEVCSKAVEVLIQELIELTELNKKLGLPDNGKSTVLPVSAIHGFLSYPLQLTTTIMTVNNCGLAVSDLPAIQGTQTSWISCIKALWTTGNIKRGNNLMFARKAAPQTWHTPPQSIATTGSCSGEIKTEVNEVAETIAEVSKTVEVVSETVAEVAENVLKAAESVSEVAESVAETTDSLPVEVAAVVTAEVAGEVAEKATEVAEVAAEVSNVAGEVAEVAGEVAADTS